MKAIVKKKAERGLWLEEMPEPTIGINDVLIKVDRTGICGTDIHIHEWGRLGAENDPGTHDCGSRVRRRSRLCRFERRRLSRR